jgi:predicted MFS family arabinose efflux permease
MKAALRRIFVVTFLAIFGMAVSAFAVAWNRVRRHRKQQEKELTTLLGTVYKKNF